MTAESTRAPGTTIRAAFPAAELEGSGRRVVLLGRREVVVFEAEDGQLFALFNRCPHQQARLDALPIGGTSLPTDTVGEFEFGFDGCIVRCPWHRYEFDARTGSCLSDPERFRVATYDVRREGDEIAVYNRRSGDAPRAVGGGV